jgi:cobalamin synthase
MTRKVIGRILAAVWLLGLLAFVYFRESQDVFMLVLIGYGLAAAIVLWMWRNRSPPNQTRREMPMTEYRGIRRNILRVAVAVIFLELLPFVIGAFGSESHLPLYAVILWGLWSSALAFWLVSYVRRHPLPPKPTR